MASYSRSTSSLTRINSAHGRAVRGGPSPTSSGRATTTIVDLEVQVGRTDQLTPAAILEPVQIGGVEVSRASLHNQSEIEEKDIRIGDQVVVERAGDVIPYVVKSLKEERDGSEEAFHMPDQCPVCGTDVVMSEDKKRARCPNPNCPAQLRESLTHYASRQAMDIQGLGEKRAQQLIDAGLVQSLSDLYELTKDKLTSLDRFAAKLAHQARGGGDPVCQPDVASYQRRLWT